jgi:hypothetical protein
MNCSYPLCRAAALYIPVVAIPTIRRVGRVQPVLSPSATDKAIMDRLGLDIATTIRLYEAEVEDYKLHCRDIAYTPKPTYLIGSVLCLQHRATYNFLDWFGVREWSRVCDGAREHGVILDVRGSKVDFRGLEWTPVGGYMEVE